MTTAARLATYASLCLVAGVADVVVLAGWAVPRAFALSTGTIPARPQERGAAAVRAAPAAAPAAATGRAAPLAARVGTVEEPIVAPSPSLGQGIPDGENEAGGPDGATTLWFATNAVRWSSGQADLAAVARAARGQPGVIIEIDGHCDDRGTDDTNHVLSLRRARGVAAALVAAGVPRERLRVRAHGSTQPRAVGRDEESRRQNRRVEIQLKVRRK